MVRKLGRRLARDDRGPTRVASVSPVRSGDGGDRTPPPNWELYDCSAGSRGHETRPLFELAKGGSERPVSRPRSAVEARSRGRPSRRRPVESRRVATLGGQVARSGRTKPVCSEPYTQVPVRCGRSAQVSPLDSGDLGTLRTSTALDPALRQAHCVQRQRASSARASTPAPPPTETRSSRCAPSTETEPPALRPADDRLANEPARSG